MDIRLLRFFVAVYEEKNITLAAQRCFVSQPSISNAIKQLEDELGVSLFERHKKGVAQTEEAHYLYPTAVHLLAELSRIPELFTQRAAKTPVAIGNFVDISQSHMAEVLAKIHHQCGDVFVDLVDHDDSQALARLTLDILKHQDEVFLPLWEEDYVLCMPDDHPLADRDTVQPAELHQFDFIECPPCEAHQQTINLLASDGLAMNLVARAQHKTQVMHLVQAGVGISFLPTGVLEASQRLVTVPLAGPRMYRRIGLCYSPSQATRPELASIIRCLSQR